MPKVRYVTRLDEALEIPPAIRASGREAAERFGFRANTYYLGLIDWSDPDDPIRRIIIPDAGELSDFGSLDASGENHYTVAPGLEHKYLHTVALLAGPRCGGFCRFCFRKRLFAKDNDEVALDVEPALDYIGRHPEITNVLLTGGDPLMLSARRLDGLLGRLRQTEHVGVIRLGTKMPAFNPYRILEDEELQAVLKRHSLPDKRIYVMVHFNHPRELTAPALQAVDSLLRAGAVVCNQTPLLRGVNDDPETLTCLFNALSDAGAVPYYVFLVRPTIGNRPFVVPVEEAYQIFELARMQCSGLGKRARLAMSHVDGKIEVLAVDPEVVYFRFHRAADPAKIGRLLAFRRNPEAIWFDDYEDAVIDCCGEGAAVVPGACRVGV